MGLCSATSLLLLWLNLAPLQCDTKKAGPVLLGPTFETDDCWRLRFEVDFLVLSSAGRSKAASHGHLKSGQLSSARDWFSFCFGFSFLQGSSTLSSPASWPTLDHVGVVQHAIEEG